MISNLFKNRKVEAKMRGFTLIEIMVSLAIFSVVMLIAVSTLLSLVDANRKAQNMQLVMSNLNFALDHLFRSVATGGVYNCDDAATLFGLEADAGLPPGRDSCQTTDGLVLTNDKSERVGYVLDSNQIWEKIDDGAWRPITSEDVNIETLVFSVEGGESQIDAIQPYINVMVKGSVEGIRGTRSEFNIQTTVTQRLIDR